MFSRFTKSFVKNLRQGKYYGGDENIKMTLFGTTRQIHKTLSGSLKNGTRLRAAISNPSRLRSSRLLIAKSEKSRSTNFSGSSNATVSRIEKLSQRRFPMKNRVLSHFQNRELDIERTLIESRDKELECSTGTANVENKTNTSEQRSITKFPLSEAKVTGLMGVLTRLPNIATDSSALPTRQLPPTRSDKLPSIPFTSELLDLDGRFSDNRELTNVSEDIMWLGDPDCGEGVPDRPLRGPCHPPDGPCEPVKQPGYPPKPRTQKKDFCFKCPPKKPCNLNKCPPDTDGTSGKAIDQTVDVLNLHSESQAVNDNPTRGISATRLLGRTIWSRNSHQLHRSNSLLKLSCRSFSKSQACDKTNEETGCKKGAEKVAEASPSCQESLKPINPQKVVPKVLYRKCPPPPKLPKLPKYPEQQKSKTTESRVTLSAPKCPPLPSLPKCPKCPPCKSTERTSSDSPCTKTKEKKKNDTWQRLGECTKRKMSTYVRSALYFENKMVFTSHHSTRRFSTSSIVIACFSSKSGSPPPLPPWKSNKCKTVEEVCEEKVDEKIEQLGCKGMDCSRDSNAECYPEKPRCAEVRKPVKEKSDKTRGSSSIDCESRMKRAKSSGLEKSVEKIDYSKTKCEPPKLMELGPCPTSPLSLSEKQDRSAGTVRRRLSLPLPKPPSAPVVLCTCRPPPKLHPGSCPHYVETETIKPRRRTEPCPKKPETCPENRLVYCSPDLRNKDECADNKSSKT